MNLMSSQCSLFVKIENQFKRKKKKKKLYIKKSDIPKIALKMVQHFGAKGT